MKPTIFFISIALFLFFLSCKKNNGCPNAEVTKTVIKACSFTADTVWSIKVDNKTYPADLADSIPAAFKQEGLKVCVQYSIITYPFACPCCFDGPYARILSITKAE